MTTARFLVGHSEMDRAERDHYANDPAMSSAHERDARALLPVVLPRCAEPDLCLYALQS